MKAYTDLEQSKKLAEILPPESADGRYWKNGWNKYNLSVGHSKELQEGYEAKKMVYIPCWSLAALLEALDDEITDEEGNDYTLTIVKENLRYQLYYHHAWDQTEDIETDYYDDMVDACYEMFVKLYKLNLL